MKTINTFFLLLFFAASAMAQDPAFSQFYANKPLLNPAMTALDEGTTLTLNHRNLWRRIPGGFKTYSATVETQWANCAKGRLRERFFNFGFGLVGQHDQEGEGVLQTNEAHVAASAYHLFGKNAAWHVGLSVGGGQKFLDFSRLTFSDQLDAINGKTKTITGAPIDLDNRNFADLAGGAAIRFGHKFGISEGFQSFGFSLRHILNPVESLDRGGRARLPGILSIHYGSVLPVWADYVASKKYFVYWSPQLQMIWQGRFGVVGYGFYGLYRGGMGGIFLRHPIGALPNGAGRNTQTLMFTGGLETTVFGNNLLRIDYSYDLNIGGLAAYGGGAHELSIKFNFFNFGPGGCSGKNSKDEKNKRNGVCPTWGGNSAPRF